MKIVRPVIRFDFHNTSHNGWNNSQSLKSVTLANSDSNYLPKKRRWVEWSIDYFFPTIQLLVRHMSIEDSVKWVAHFFFVNYLLFPFWIFIHFEMFFMVINFSQTSHPSNCPSDEHFFIYWLNSELNQF